MERITTGNFAQLWLVEFCRINNINYEKDKSSPYVEDIEDLKICGTSIDCKVSILDSMVGQVSVACLNSKVDAYSFFLTDNNCSFIKPYGFIRKKDFMEKSILIKHG